MRTAAQVWRTCRSWMVAWWRRLAGRDGDLDAGLDPTLGRDRETARVVAASAAVGLALAALTVALSGPWDAGQRVAERQAAAAGEAPPASGGDGHDADGLPQDHEGGEGGARPGEAGEGALPAAAQVLAPATGDAGPPPGDAALAAALGPSLADPALGPGGASGSVVDLTTGERLYGDDAASPRTPASTIKLVTSVVALDVLGPDHRLSTTVVWDDDHGRVVLVGGGDTTLTPEQISVLADRTATALAERGVAGVAVGYDVSLYATERHPIGVNDNLALITPLQMNAGRLDDSRHGPAPRAEDPAAEAAAAFARELRVAGIRVDHAADPVRGSAPDGAERLAIHRSATVSTLVEDMLTHSDNDLAEALARVAAVAAGHGGDADGVGRVMTERLRELGVPREGARIADASGLDRTGRLTAELLTDTLRVAASPDRPELRAAVTGLPVAGFTGTLADRYDPSAGTAASAGAGLVRAKTGTLTGVNTLAGTAVTPEGRVLAFAFLADATVGPVEAQAALDAAAATLASCSCH
ncbi:D-alanyl-D-alanine carboxypeptidase/D-alanyl-D-alanine endopeptidase [Streptomyces sp. 4N509B]|uniref:D-alanyl-D-alanine carboxypeptidase/D-alanyl-D-alanine endopeptidase n=1 Tax=Streptomyces sp. 4N509B TaxID=3457413 RepID=UPI003FD3273C